MTVIRRKRSNKREIPVYTATCSTGLENLLQEEIISFGGKSISKSRGAVSWTGRLESVYRACLWSRVASRVLLQLNSFIINNPDDLYKKVKKIDWELHLNNNTDFAINCTLSGKPAIEHSHFASLRVKDAIVDYFRERTGKRPDINTRNPDIRLNLHIKDSQAALSLDMSGESLHRRGYRRQTGEAPLKETLAAGICLLSGINKEHPQDLTIIDPMCGSGTLLIEAALIISNSAPGLQRPSFGFMKWQRHTPKIWQALVQEALALEDQGTNRKWPKIIGYDADPKAVAAARANIENAGLEEYITVEHKQVSDLTCPSKKGIIITNPPYGERLSEKEIVKYLYRFLGRKFQQEFKNWQMAFFSANPDMVDLVQAKWTNRFPLYNGPIKCSLVTGKWQENEKEKAREINISSGIYQGDAPELYNRLRKNYQKLQNWLQSEDISCFRLYDADLPEYNLAIDVYGSIFHVQEYAPSKNIDPIKASNRFKTALLVIKELFNLSRHQLFIKQRKPQKGKEQYQKKPTSGKFYEVKEGQARFLLNFTDYLDTGLFLDHRQTRTKIGRLAKGKNFLNLFGYTGSATVHAAMNGAISTATVDTSAKYLRRTLSNLALNGLGGPLHTIHEIDCIQWLGSGQRQFELIFVDPPTFSNSRHRQQTFSVQEDHEQLLELAMNRLTDDGLLIFSTNYRTFSLAESLSHLYDIKEITEETIPPDFKQKNNIHRSFEFRHKNHKEKINEQQ